METLTYLLPSIVTGVSESDRSISVQSRVWGYIISEGESVRQLPCFGITIMSRDECEFYSHLL